MILMPCSDHPSRIGKYIHKPKRNRIIVHFLSVSTTRPCKCWISTATFGFHTRGLGRHVGLGLEHIPILETISGVNQAVVLDLTM